MALESIAFFRILGMPLMFWLGVFGLLFISLAFITGFLRVRGKQIPFEWHIRLAGIGLAIVFAHALLGVAGYL